MLKVNKRVWSQQRVVLDGEVLVSTEPYGVQFKKCGLEEGQSLVQLLRFMSL